MKVVLRATLIFLALLFVSCTSQQEAAPIATQVVQLPANVAEMVPTAAISPTTEPAAGAQQPEAAKATVVPEEPPPIATLEPAVTPSPTAAPPTATPAPTATLLPTATPLPTATLLPTAEPSPTPLPEPEWLIYLNSLRDIGGLHHLTDDVFLSEASRAHAAYMVLNDDPIAHRQDVNNPHYNKEAARVAPKANLFATSLPTGNYDWSMNFWVSAPFHILQVIDPELQTVGYGQFRDTNGSVQMAGVLDVALAPRARLAPDVFPLYFPADGGETWILRLSLYEWPESYGNCPGYSNEPPSGPTIVLQLGSGETTPRVTNYRFLQGSVVLESCIFDETTYLNPNPYAQQQGRTILNERDAVVLIPFKPLEVGKTYTVYIEVNGQAHNWSFTAVSRPRS